MNKERRNRITKAITKLEEMKNEIDEILLEEENAFDNMPENLQCSERGEESEEAINTLNEAIESLEDTINSLEEI